MIKAQQKPLHEILAALVGYRRILNVGCGGCVSECMVGGQMEVLLLNFELNRAFEAQGGDQHVDAYMVPRQCDGYYLKDIEKLVENYDCLISMACGAGVQLLAEWFVSTPVFPAVNTEAIGIDRQYGVYEEKCRACGECILWYTGGICPVTRCAKGLFNGPCGGVNDGKCEISDDIPCAWYEIYTRLKAQNRLESIMRLHPAIQWHNQIPRASCRTTYNLK